MFYQLFDAATAVHSAVAGGSGDTVSVLAQAPAPTAPTGIETSGVGTFLRTQVLPPLLAVGAIVLLSKSMKSNWSAVVTIVSLSMIGLVWFGFSANPDAAVSTGIALARLIVPGV